VILSSCEFSPTGNGSTAAGNWGDYNCDVPYQTLENLMEFLGNMSEDVSFNGNHRVKVWWSKFTV